MNPALNANTNSGLAILLALPVEPATEFRNWRPDGPVTATGEHPHSPAKVNSLSDADLRFLQTVVDRPGKPSGAYSKLAGLGTHQAIAARKKLIAEGYLREHRVNASAKGRTSIVLEPLPVALELCGSGSRRRS